MSEAEKTKLINKIGLITLICVIVIGIIAICIAYNTTKMPSSYSHSGSSSSSSSSSYSSSGSSSSSNNCGGPGKCKYKVDGNYVCSKSATNGSYCQEHWDYLNSAYNSLFGGN